MGKIAFLFSGQGAQYTGMGLSLKENSPAAAAVFETAEKIRPGTAEQCFSAGPEELKITKNTQPCVFTVALAAAQALSEQGIRAEGCAGFSLGELCALTFAGAFSPEEGMALVCRRGELMQEAAEQKPGAMAAVLKLPNEKVEEICSSFQEIWPVNYNCSGQLVAAGNPEQLPAFCEAVSAAGGRAKPLAVGGGFHTPYMRGASEAFLSRLKKDFPMKAPMIPVYSNKTALPYDFSRGKGIGLPPEELLAAQMAGPVLWQRIVENMAAAGFSRFVEVGPGSTLIGFGKRIAKSLPNGEELQWLHVEDSESLQEAVRILKGE